MSNAFFVPAPDVGEAWTVEPLLIALSDETTDITVTSAAVTFRAPYACRVVAVRASLNTASSAGIPTFDILEAGVSILGPLLTIDANELTSVTAAVPVVITDDTLTDDAEMTIDITVAGTGAKGAKVCLYLLRTA